MASDSRIKVSVRCRPLSQRERYDVKCVGRLADAGLVVSNQGDPQERPESLPFQFDFFFDEDDNQADVYADSVLDLIDSALEGNNATCLCYGQTGTGKTWTMLGEVGDSGDRGQLVKPNSGIFLRTLTDLFTYKARSANKMHVCIMLSIVEIYINEVRDLLNKREVMRVREAGDECAMPDLRVEEVREIGDVYEFYKAADACRSTTATHMNDVSSRSHAVFMIDVVTQVRTPANPDPPTREKLLKAVAKDPSVLKTAQPISSSRICLVDLAGSERIKKSGVDGKALEEAKAINTSLSALGKVINSLYEGQKHISYRDSRLTRILKPCFADPQARVLLCANISPTIKSFQETKSTLRFANQVKQIKASGSAADATAELEYIERLKGFETVAADVRICQAQHDHVLQVPCNIEGVLSCAGGATKGRRQMLKEQAIERCRVAAAEMQKQKDAELAEAKGRIYGEITGQFEKEMEEKLRALSAGLAEAEEAAGKQAEETARVQADKEKKVKEHTSDAKKVKKKRQEAEGQKEERLKKSAQQEEELKGVEEELALAVDAHEKEFGEDKRKDEAEARAEEAFECWHKGTKESLHVWRRLVADRLGSYGDLLRLRNEIDRCEAVEALNPSTSLCSSLSRWLIERAMRTAKSTAADVEKGPETPPSTPQTPKTAETPKTPNSEEDPVFVNVYSGCPGTGRSFTHLTKTLLDYSEWPHPLNVFELSVSTQSLEGTAEGESGATDGPQETELSDSEAEVPAPAPAAALGSLAVRPLVAPPETSTRLVNPYASADSGLSSSTGALRPMPKQKVVTIGATGAQGRQAVVPGQPVQYDFLSDKKRKADEEKRKKDQDERKRREVAHLQQQRKAYHRMEMGSEVTRFHDEEEADKNYLMGIYDTQGLVTDILRYLQSGTQLIKHGRSGKPHKRKFWLTEAKNELCWTDDHVPDAKKSSISLNDVTSIIMGQYSKVFKRQSNCGPANSEFYFSFSLVLKQGKRTIDCVAETASEFEAWLLGLANLLHLEPVWGEPLDLDSLPPAERAREKELTSGARTTRLSEREVNVALRHHVRPSQLLNVKKKIIDMRDEVMHNITLFGGDMQQVHQNLGGIHPPSLNSKNALLVTKGELRYYTSIDIFRTCVMWKLFEELDLLYDPHFRMPTYARSSSGATGSKR